METYNGKEELTYLFTYKNKTVPKVVIFFNNVGIVSAKSINLFDETNDKMNAIEVKKYFATANFETQNPPEWGKSHAFPSNKYLVDKKLGITVSYNTARKDEVQFIDWYLPKH